MDRAAVPQYQVPRLARDPKQCSPFLHHEELVLVHALEFVPVLLVLLAEPEPHTKLRVVPMAAL
eukprot:879861-Rhodomonas_salina.1